MYQVWIKQDNVEPRCVFQSWSPLDCDDYAKSRIAHGNNVEWIEIRDTTGVLETVYRRQWSGGTL